MQELVFHFSTTTPSAEQPLRRPRLSRQAEKQPKRNHAVIQERQESPLFVPLGDSPSGQIDLISAPELSVEASQAADLELKQKKEQYRHHNRTTMSEHQPLENDILTRTSPPNQPRSKHFTYRDNKGVLREIWQPGDPGGSRDTEFPDNPAFKVRWRFFQSDIGPIVRGSNSPPHCVVLDDKAAWDILSSKAYTTREKNQYWPFDFASVGHIRSGRPNRGRPAIVGEEEGDKIDTQDGQGARFIAWSLVGDKKNQKKYHFTGERTGYREVKVDISRYRKRSVAKEQTPKRKADGPLDPRHKRPRVSAYLHSTPSPPWPGRDRRTNVLRNSGARSAYRMEDHSLHHSDWSPQATGGAKTVYAGMANGVGHEDDFPERIRGRIVSPKISTAPRTPYPGTSMGARTPYTFIGAQTPYPSNGLWQDVKRMEEELGEMRNTLQLRDDEIAGLKEQLEAMRAAPTEKLES